MPLPLYGIRIGPQTHITEDYVCVPPAFWITDERGDTWTLGFHMPTHPDLMPNGHFAFCILRNGQPVPGEYASHIEMRRGRVRIFTRNQVWKEWTGRSFV